MSKDNNLDDWFASFGKNSQKNSQPQSNVSKKSMLSHTYQKTNRFLHSIDTTPRTTTVKQSSEATNQPQQTSLNLFGSTSSNSTTPHKVPNLFNADVLGTSSSVANQSSSTSQVATSSKSKKISKSDKSTLELDKSIQNIFSGNKPSIQYQTVSQIQRKLRKKLHSIPEFKTIYITGGITTIHPYGYICFSGLDDPKNKKASINMIIPKPVYDKIPFKLTRGTKVDVIGRISVSRGTNIQISAQRIMPKGASATLLRLQATKKYLTQHGCFDKQHHKKIPKFPKQIAVITSKRGAVIRDIIETTRKRDKTIQIVLFPANMSNPSSMVKQIQNVDNQDFDTCIIGRGGGSKQDLQPFNDKNLCVATYKCTTPIIAAVGHGIDHPFIDYVADDTEVTPTGAAEKASPDIPTYVDLMHQYDASITDNMKNIIKDNYEQLSELSDLAIYKKPVQTFIEPRINKLDDIHTTIVSHAKNYLYNATNQLHQLNTNLMKYNPQQTITNQLATFQMLNQKLNTTEQSYLQNKVHKLDKFNTDLDVNEKFTLNQKQQQLNDIIHVNQQFSFNKIYEAKLQLLKDLSKQLRVAEKFNLQHNTQQLRNGIQFYKQFNYQKLLKAKKQTLESLKNQLEILSPLQTLKRGYSYTTVNHQIIDTIAKAKQAKIITLHLKDGNIKVKVIK